MKSKIVFLVLVMLSAAQGLYGAARVPAGVMPAWITLDFSPVDADEQDAINAKVAELITAVDGFENGKMLKAAVGEADLKESLRSALSNKNAPFTKKSLLILIKNLVDNVYGLEVPEERDLLSDIPLLFFTLIRLKDVPGRTATFHSLIRALLEGVREFGVENITDISTFLFPEVEGGFQAWFMEECKAVDANRSAPLWVNRNGVKNPPATDLTRYGIGDFCDEHGFKRVAYIKAAMNQAHLVRPCEDLSYLFDHSDFYPRDGKDRSNAFLKDLYRFYFVMNKVTKREGRIFWFDYLISAMARAEMDEEIDLKITLLLQYFFGDSGKAGGAVYDYFASKVEKLEPRGMDGPVYTRLLLAIKASKTCSPGEEGAGAGAGAGGE